MIRPHNRPLLRSLGVALALASLAAAKPAWANDPPPAVVEEELQKKAAAHTALPGDATPTDGWTRKLTLGATGAANSTSSVVGTADGTTLQIGVLLDGEADLRAGQHDWQTLFKLQHAQSRTPAVDVWLKSADNFELQSTWLYRLRALDWVGPFARARLQTQVWRGATVRGNDATVETKKVDGTTSTRAVLAGDEVDLTRAFEPIVVAETVGAFAKPFAGKKLTLQAKLGAGGQHVFADGGYAVTGYDKDSATLKLSEIETTHQAGGELEVQGKGALNSTISWTARGRLFFPIVTKSEQSITGVDAMTTEVQAGVSIKLAKWASLDYVLNVRRIPLVLDDWQIQHGLLLTTGFNLL